MIDLDLLNEAIEIVSPDICECSCKVDVLRCCGDRKEGWDFQIDDESFNLQVESTTGGSEGDGEHVDMVVKLSSLYDHKYFKITGYYSSWEGREWRDKWFEVVPKEVTVIEYVGV